MNAEIWRSEIALYGFMIMNVLAVASCLGWAYRRGHLTGLDDAAVLKTLDLTDPPAATSKENGNG